MRKLLVLLVLLSSSSFADEKLTFVKIYDQFIVSNAAASKCAKPDEETLTAFLVNFQTVTVTPFRS